MIKATSEVSGWVLDDSWVDRCDSPPPSTGKRSHTSPTQSTDDLSRSTHYHDAATGSPFKRRNTGSEEKKEETPDAVRKLEAAIISGEIDPNSDLTRKQQQLIQEASRSLKAEDLYSPKRQSLGNRVTKLVVDEIIVPELPRGVFSEQGAVDLIKDSKALQTLLPPMLKAGTPTKLLGISMPGLSPHGTPFVDLDHITSPDQGYHWAAPGEVVTFVQGPALNVRTGVYVGVFRHPGTGATKYSSFFPQGRFTSEEELSAFLKGGTRIASCNNRYLCKNTNIVYEVYMREQNIHIRTAFPIFQFVEIESDAEKMYELIPGEGEYSKDQVLGMVYGAVDQFMQTIGQKQSPLRFTIGKREHYIFDIAATYTQAYGINSGIYIKISADIFQALFASYDGFSPQDILDSLAEL